MKNSVCAFRVPDWLIIGAVKLAPEKCSGYAHCH